jgi:hypothetical protein
MTFQGWLGDTVNLFAVFPTGKVTYSLAGFATAVSAVGPLSIIHVLNACLLLILGIIVVIMTFKRTKSKGAKISSILGVLFILSAMMGGVLFVLSGFSNNAYSAQMGGSFIAAYAAYFIVLYYTK